MKVIGINGSARKDKNVGDVFGDDEGMANMRNIGENMVWLLKSLSNE